MNDIFLMIAEDKLCNSTNSKWYENSSLKADELMQRFFVVLLKLGYKL